MRYLTDRKRAEGLWFRQVGDAASLAHAGIGRRLAILIPLFIFTFGGILGAPHEEVVAYYARPSRLSWRG